MVYQHSHLKLTSVAVKLEFEHKASPRKVPNCDGFTHDWFVIVKGAPGVNIECFVEKVVYHLHPSYLFPRRAVREFPFIIRECGYAGFVMPIDVYLKTKEEPKKFSLFYDLKLSQNEVVHQRRKETFVIREPGSPFMELLIKGGGELVRTTKMKKKKNDGIIVATKKQKTGEVRKYKKRKTNDAAAYIPSPKDIARLDTDMEFNQPVKRLKVLLPRHRIEQSTNIKNRSYF